LAVRSCTEAEHPANRQPPKAKSQKPKANRQPPKAQNEVTIDHDQIFKQLIEAFFQDFMQLFCADEAKLIDFSRVEFLREEYFTGRRTRQSTSLGFGREGWLTFRRRKVRAGPCRV